jgi:hypothetical protein
MSHHTAGRPGSASASEDGAAVPTSPSPSSTTNVRSGSQFSVDCLR